MHGMHTNLHSHAFPVGCLLVLGFTEMFTVSQALRCFSGTDVKFVQETQLRCFPNTFCQSIFLSNYHSVVDKRGEREAGRHEFMTV